MIALYALAAFQAASGLQQADLIRQQAGVTDAINQLNAKYTDIDADNAMKEGYTESARYQTEVDKTVGAQREGFAADGVDVNYGTAAEVQADTRVTGFLNNLDIQNQARAKALGLRQQASNIRLQGSMGRSQAELNAGGATTQGIASGLQSGFRAYTESQPNAGRGSTPTLGTSNYSRK